MIVTPAEPSPTESSPAAGRVGVVRELGRQPALDGVRGLAVLLVVLVHVGFPVTSGGIGVDVFFVLSGFLITTLLVTERDRTGTISFSAFYLRRARRLLPALLLMLAGFAVAQYFFGLLPTGIPLGWAILVPLLFASNWIALVYNAGALNAINPTWSLSIEEQFYLLWPLALWFAVRRRVRPLVIVATLVVLCIGLVAFADWLPWRYRWMSIYFNPFDRGAELLFGCMAAFLWRYRYVPKVVSWRPTGWIALGLLLLMAKHHQVEIHDYVGLAPWADIQAEYIFAAALAFVLLLCLVENPGSDLGVLFKFPPLRYLGKISYGVYLFHLPTIAIIRDRLPNHSDRLRGPLAIAVVVGLATISWYGLEAPIQRWGKRSSARRAAAARRGAADSPAQHDADEGRAGEPAASIAG